MAEFEVAMTGGGDFRFRVVYTVTPVSGGVQVAVTSQWMRRSGAGSGYNGAAPYYLTIGGYGTKSGTRQFDGSLNGWQWIETTSVTFVSGTQTYITATFDTDTASAGAGSIVSLTVPIAVASKSSFSPSGTFDAGAPVTINTNRQSTAYTHDITYEFGGASGTIGTGVGASVSWTPPLSMLSEIPNHTQAAGTITTVTKNGATVIGSTTTGYVLRAPASVVPTCTGVTGTDQNSTVASVVGLPVQGLSRLKLDVAGAGVYGSTITGATATMQGTTVNSGGEILVTQSGSIPIEGKVTDSRGRTGTWSGAVTALAYSQPGATAFQARRCDAGGVPKDDGQYLRVDLNAAIASLINGTERNLLTLRAFTRPSGGGVWTPRNVLTPGGLTYNSFFIVTGGGIFSTTQSYDVRVQVQDRFNTATLETGVATAAVALDMNGNKVGVGKIHEQGALDVGPGGIYDDGDLVINESDVATTAKAGIVELATQAEADAGTDSARAMTPKQARDALYSPHAEAAGSIATAASGTTAVSFPAGRFTVPPIVTPGAITHTNVCIPYISNVTATGFNVAIFTLGGAQVAATFSWTATQMRSNSASG